MFKCNKPSTFKIFSERKIGADGAKNGWKLVRGGSRHSQHSHRRMSDFITEILYCK